MQVKVKNSCELKRYVSQNIRTIRSNSWNCTVNKFGVLAKFVFSQALLYSFQLLKLINCLGPVYMEVGDPRGGLPTKAGL